ncbi:MAG TPA: methyltransferase domain-containing protein [Candidatus Wallbacteria bacterium]|nr:methyltransferase domain-containing protein [Candidatus Wallbacteria bacterium]
MSSVKEHYDNHLSAFYSWMTGELETAVKNQAEVFRKLNILPAKTGNAIDLGSGHGVQALALESLGFKTTAIDFNERLLDELKRNSIGTKIETAKDDICNILNYREKFPEVITCCGDTISHLPSEEILKTFFFDCNKILINNGKLFLTFRDYSKELTDVRRFIPVKSDDDRILTCVLEYFHDRVRVTDLLYEKIDGAWIQKASSYIKLRIGMEMVEYTMTRAGFSTEYKEAGIINTLIGRKNIT